MKNSILILNAGSSSLKFSLFTLEKSADSLQLKFRGMVDQKVAQLHLVIRDMQNKIIKDTTQAIISADFHAQQTTALTLVLQVVAEFAKDYQIIAAGHRVVHGGEKFSAPVLINAEVMRELTQLTSLAPLHQPYNLAGIQTVTQVMPAIPQVACFDTAFHHAQPTLAKWFGIPRKYFAAGVKRYGFHGLSFEYITSVLPNYFSSRMDGKIIIAHLGQGASMCALHKRQSQATTMGFTALDGLLMGTRCGLLDPGVILHLQTVYQLSVEQITNMLYQESGLLGVSMQSSDMRTLLQSEDPHAKEAIDLFVYRIVSEIGSLVAILQGLDVLIFTGGIGEHSAEIRNRVCEALSWLGIKVNYIANQKNSNYISTEDSQIGVLMIPTDEELMIARHTAELFLKQK